MLPCCNYSQRRVHNRSPDRHEASGRPGVQPVLRVLISAVVRAAIANDRPRSIAELHSAPLPAFNLNTGF